MKIEKEIFPAGTDSRFFREVGIQLFHNLPMIYFGFYCLEILLRIFFFRFSNLRTVFSTCFLQSLRDPTVMQFHSADSPVYSIILF